MEKMIIGKNRAAGKYGCLLLILVFVVLALTACGKKQTYIEESEKFLVGVVTKSSTSEYWMSIRLGMEAAARKFDMEVLFLSPDSELQEEVQGKLVRTLIERKADVLAVSPIDSYGSPEYLAMAQEQGIPVVSFDTGFEGGTVPYIGIDNIKAGYELAKYLAQQMDHEGQAGIITGDLNQMCHLERKQGFEEYMATEPEIEIVFVESGYANLQMSEQKVRALKRNYPKLKGIMATSAVTALGLEEEMSREDISIVTVDAQEDSLNALDNGVIVALAAQSGYEIGYATIEYIEDMRNNKAETPAEKIVPADIITKEKVETYRKEHQNEKYPK